MPISQANIKTLEVINEELNSLRHIEAVKAVIDSIDQMRNENLNSFNEKQLDEYLHQSVRAPLYKWYLSPEKATYEDLLQTKLVLFILASYWPLNDNCCISSNPISDPKVNRVLFVSGHIADRNALSRYWAHTENNPHPVTNINHAKVYSDPILFNRNMASSLKFQMNQKDKLKNALTHNTLGRLFIPLALIAFAAVAFIFFITATFLSPYLLPTYAVLAGIIVGSAVLGLFALAISHAIDERSKDMIGIIDKLTLSVNKQIADDSNKLNNRSYVSEHHFIRNIFKQIETIRKRANSFALIRDERVSSAPKIFKRSSSEPSLLVNGKLNQSAFYSSNSGHSRGEVQDSLAAQISYMTPSNN